MTKHRLDCLGEACPVPLIKTQRKLATMKVGESLIIDIDHSCAMKNIPEWAIKEGHAVDILETDEGLWAVHLVKSK